MSPELIAKFKSIFEEKRSNLIYTKEILNTDFYIQKDDLADEIDLSSTELETSMRMRLRTREALFLKKINEALRRIANGTFGQCIECSSDIELRRLEARPTASLCVSCKEDQEHREHIHIHTLRSKSLGKKIRFA